MTMHSIIYALHYLCTPLLFYLIDLPCLNKNKVQVQVLYQKFICSTYVTLIYKYFIHVQVG